MAELVPSERLQPCLLDRLTDDDPHNQKESRDQRVISLQRYRNAVLRDLSWLLNASAHTSAEGIEEYEDVKTSVLNFGVRSVTGMTTSGFEAEELRAQLQEAVRRFEPRVAPNSLMAKVSADPSAMHNRAISFEIKGELWAQPVPEALFIQTTMDLETGKYELNRGSA